MGATHTVASTAAPVERRVELSQTGMYPKVRRVQNSGQPEGCILAAACPGATGYVAMLWRRRSSPSSRRVLETWTLRRRPSTLDHDPVRRLPNSASACVPSLSSSSSGGTYARDFLRFMDPVETGSASASAVLEDDDREEMGNGSSCGAEAANDARFEVLEGAGSGLRIFLETDVAFMSVHIETKRSDTYVFSFGSA